MDFNPVMAEVFTILMKICGTDDFKFSGNKINEIFGNTATINMKADFERIFVNNSISFSHLLKIGFLLMLVFASFMLNFHFHRNTLKYNDTKAAKEYDEKQDPERALDENKKG